MKTPLSTIHPLKTWPEIYEAMLSGAKSFDVRKDDRNFTVGDTLWLMEYEPSTEKYSGRSFQIRVTYKMSGGRFGIEPGFVVLGLALPGTGTDMRRLNDALDMLHTGGPEAGTSYEDWARDIAYLALNPVGK